MISIKEKIYSKAFEDGVNYAIQKMFAKKDEDMSDLSYKGNSNHSGYSRAMLLGGGVGTPAAMIGRFAGKSRAIALDEKGKDDDRIRTGATTTGGLVGGLVGAGTSAGAIYGGKKLLDYADKKGGDTVVRKIKDAIVGTITPDEKTAKESKLSGKGKGRSFIGKTIDKLYDLGKEENKGKFGHKIAKKIKEKVEKEARAHVHDTINTIKNKAVKPIGYGIAGLMTAGGMIGGAAGSRKNANETLEKRRYKRLLEGQKESENED